MKFYHATTRIAAKQIVREGVLRGDVFGCVYLCTDPLDACKFLIIRGMRKISVLELDIDKESVSRSCDHSESFFGCKAYYHTGDIRLRGNVPITEYEFNL